jgi:ABC-type glycerol-3-phosphate transport system permease component
MNITLALLVVIFIYSSLTIWVTRLTLAIKKQQRSLVVSLLVLLPALFILSFLIPLQERIVLLSLLPGCLTLLLARVLSPGDQLLPKKDTKLTLLHLILITGSALFLVPFVWMVVTSLKNDIQTTAYPPVWIPHPVLWRNYPDALKYLPPESHFGLVNLWNTLVIAIMSVIGTVLSSSLVAYGFARLKWPGRDWVFGLLLATMMLPDAVTMMPRFLIFRSLHWVDTLLPLWVPAFFASAFNVFLLRQFFLGVPQELEDAAIIDGCGPLGTWWRVMLPMVKPALAAVTIMTFLGAWKDFMGPLIYISSPEKMPLSYVLQLYNAAHGGEPALLMAATTLVVLPVIVLFFFTQRYFIEGVSLTGLGGR